MNTIDINKVIKIHDKIIAKYGGIEGIKDFGLIESALNNAFTTFYGEDLYKTDIDKIANIFCLLVKNHGFNDANKRTAVAMFNILININDININHTFQELEDLALNVVVQDLETKDITEWIDKHSD